MIYPTISREYQEGNICGSENTDTHQISNLMADGKDLLTMHIYTPPLLVMNCYSLTDSEVHEFNTSECVPISGAVL
jgi:cysteine dioxygenase